MVVPRLDQCTDRSEIAHDTHTHTHVHTLTGPQPQKVDEPSEWGKRVIVLELTKQLGVFAAHDKVELVRLHKLVYRLYYERV